ncbi:hypothetical protein G4B88_009256 [Cannabis sativa]|uniref:S-locus receptor kinase C-terminal domain-containing protein n=1 Tax=Cannabis sativa TaxID=3483 RepID=A0A7J6ETW7_CANSA|nr:hypothetical protein G4B88_009256 [Cannabis sativa]
MEISIVGRVAMAHRKKFLAGVHGDRWTQYIHANFKEMSQHVFQIKAWQLWSEGKGVEFVDEAMGGSYVALEAIRCIHVGLLCVQDHTTDRPSMADVIFMLSNETNRPQPIRPIFTYHNSPRLQKVCDTYTRTNRNQTPILVEWESLHFGSMRYFAWV